MDLFKLYLLGAIIQNVTGINAEDYITANILDPLGMKDTSFKPGIELAKRHLIRLKVMKANDDMINGVNGSDEMIVSGVRHQELQVDYTLQQWICQNC